MTTLIDPRTLITYSLAALILALTPGPGQALVMAYTVKGGRNDGVVAALGLEFGTLTHTVAAALGLSAVLATSALAFAIVKFAGALYLLSLGVRLLLAKQAAPAPIGRKVQTRARVFRQAVTTGILNPKIALFFLAFLPQFVRPERGAVILQFLILGGILSLFGFIVESMLAVATSSMGNLLSRSSAFHQWRQRITGLLFIGIGARLALARRT
jgi:threonine/homoserine/homoserine lactone efflux protein